MELFLTIIGVVIAVLLWTQYRHPDFTTKEIFQGYWALIRTLAVIAIIIWILCWIF